MTDAKIIDKLDPKHREIFDQALPYLEEGRPGDIEHVYFLLEQIISFRSDRIPVDLDILVPTAIFHDIGHSAVLPEHFVHLTGQKKIRNGKLVHMLTGAKIAKDVLAHVGYDKAKSDEIVGIVAVHDADQVDGMGMECYDTENKKIFHDFDRLGIMEPDRFKIMLEKFTSNDNFEKLRNELDKLSSSFFFDELQKLSDSRKSEIIALIDAKEAELKDAN